MILRRVLELSPRTDLGVLHHACRHRASAVPPSSSWDMGFDYSPDERITGLLQHASGGPCTGATPSNRS
ncbi:hypothetical protein U1Q18_027581 [Sarracenia purpurea var. burkii]